MKLKKGDLVHYTTNCEETDYQHANDRTFLLVTEVREEFSTLPITCVWIDSHTGKPIAKDNAGSGERFYSENELKLVYSPD